MMIIIYPLNLNIAHEASGCMTTGSANTRDERGSTLLALAAQHDNEKVAMMLLTYWKVRKVTWEMKTYRITCRTFMALDIMYL
jgi:hypothetical protein